MKGARSLIAALCGVLAALLIAYATRRHLAEYVVVPLYVRLQWVELSLGAVPRTAAWVVTVGTCAVVALATFHQRGAHGRTRIAARPDHPERLGELTMLVENACVDPHAWRRLEETLERIRHVDATYHRFAAREENRNASMLGPFPPERHQAAARRNRLTRIAAAIERSRTE